MSTVRWHTDLTGAGYDYSNNDTRATRDGVGDFRLLFARRGMVRGVWYWETEYTNTTSTNLAMNFYYGFAQASANQATWPGEDDNLGWSNDINGTGRWHNSVVLGSSAISFSTRPRMIVCHWFDADTGHYSVNYSDNGTTQLGWRDLAYHTANHNGSSWDNGKIWYPAYALDTENERLDILTTPNQCYFSPPAGALYLSQAPSSVQPRGVSDEVFNEWLASDADRVMLIEAQYSTGEPDLLGLTGLGSTPQLNGLTLINDIENQPGNEVFTAGHTNAVIRYGERKYWEVRPTQMLDPENTWIGFKIEDNIDPTLISGSEANELGLNPNGDRWINGEELGCFCSCAQEIIKLEPEVLYLFEFPEEEGFPEGPGHPS